MPGVPRLVLFGLGVLIAVIGSGGAPNGQGADDFIGGILILISWFWPKASYELRVQGQTYEIRGNGWPSARQILREIVQDYGVDPAALDWDGFLTRFWSSPFPISWAKGRQYDEHLVEQEKARLIRRSS